MKKHVEIIQRAALEMDLHGEPILGMPLVEIYGNCRVLIENHHGVSIYSCCEISVRSDFGSICVRGNQLEIVSMTKHRLVITGKVESVTLVNGR